MRRIVAILFLLRTIWKERRGRGSARFLLKSFGVSTDELCRIADAIDRFGLDNLL